MRCLWYPVGVVLVFLGALTIGDSAARALPEAGTDVLPVVAMVDVVSLLGEESIPLTGLVTVERGPPRLEDGIEVRDLRIEGLELLGASGIGAITVAERPDQGGSYVSAGEVRSLQAGRSFPASSFLDLFVDVTASASPVGGFSLHNDDALHLTPRRGGQKVSLDAWPPLGATYQLDPIFGVDNDRDGHTDEDTADDDGDGLTDEDRPGPDPGLAEAGAGCGDDADCDGRDGEDPPVELCTPGVCDSDGDGLFDEDPACVPLFTPESIHLKVGFCVRSFALEFAPENPSYSVARGGPSSLHPADILALTPLQAGAFAGATGVLTSDAGGRSEAPFVRVSCASLGLSPDGCDGGEDGDRDDLDALSYGDDLPADGGRELWFSVGPGAEGLPSSAVEVQRNCPPALPGVSPEPEPDVFGSLLDGANYHVLDGNGPVGACSPTFPLGLIEAATVRDDLDALYQQDGWVVDQDGDGVPERPVYFSLDAVSPSLTAAGFLAGDVLRTVDGAPPTVYASAAELGLTAADDLDALCLREDGDGVYTAEDVLYLSLAPGSPTLAAIGAGPGDVLVAGTLPAVAEGALSLGLIATDDVNALACRALSNQAGAGGDVNCDGVTDSVDAALVLQYDAGIIGLLSCSENSDVNEDGAVDSNDAALILRFTAGLIERLPVSGATSERL